VFFRDAQFFFRADHRARFNAADGGLLEFGYNLPGLMTIVEHRAFARVGDFERLFQPALAEPGEHIRRASQNGCDARTIVQFTERQAVSIGVLVDLHHLCYHELLFIPGQAGIFIFQLPRGLFNAHEQHVFHFQTDAGQDVGKVFDANVF